MGVGHSTTRLNDAIAQREMLKVRFIAVRLKAKFSVIDENTPLKMAYRAKAKW